LLFADWASAPVVGLLSFSEAMRENDQRILRMGSILFRWTIVRIL
jgi:hypothetical protein